MGYNITKATLKLYEKDAIRSKLFGRYSIGLNWKSMVIRRIASRRGGTLMRKRAVVGRSKGPGVDADGEWAVASPPPPAASFTIPHAYPRSPGVSTRDV